MFNKFLVALLLITSVQSFAGQDGNGGFGLNCSGKITLLDLYEAKERYKYSIDLGPENLSVDQKVEIMLKRLKKINRYAADRYAWFYKHLWTRATVLNGQIVVKNDDILVGSELAYKSDIGSAILPEDCKLIALARNLKTVQQGIEQNIFFIGKYWDNLDNNNKAALIMHELIYFDYVTNQLSQIGLGLPFNESLGSTPVRKIIGFIASKDADNASIEQIFANFSLYKKHEGYNYWLPTLFNFDINGFIVNYVNYIRLSKDGKFITEFQSYSPERRQKFNSFNSIQFGKQKYSATLISDPYTTTIFTFIGKDIPSSFFLDNFSIQLDSVLYSADGDVYIELYENKKIKKIDSRFGSVKMSKNHFAELAQRKVLKTSEGIQASSIEFYPNGKVRCLTARTRMSVNVKNKFFAVSTYDLHFDLKGNVIATKCIPTKSK